MCFPRLWNYSLILPIASCLKRVSFTCYPGFLLLMVGELTGTRNFIMAGKGSLNIALSYHLAYLHTSVKDRCCLYVWATLLFCINTSPSQSLSKSRFLTFTLWKIWLLINWLLFYPLSYQHLKRLQCPSSDIQHPDLQFLDFFFFSVAFHCSSGMWPTLQLLFGFCHHLKYILPFK